MQRRTVRRLAECKQQLFTDVLDRQGGASAFPSTVTLLRRPRAAGIATGLVTSSRDSELLLAAAGMSELFDSRIEGSDAIRLGLPGKPDPAMFLKAARRLGVLPVGNARSPIACTISRPNAWPRRPTCSPSTAPLTGKTKCPD